jgi:hypothetical protein
MKLTVNKLLSMQKIVRERLNELKNLRSEVSKKERTFFGNEDKKVVEPMYDVKEVDKKITKLERFLMDSDFSVKESNAKTKVEINVDVDDLLSPIQ